MFLTIKSNSNDRKTTKHTRARVHTTHTRLFRTRTTVPLHQETERSTLLVRGHGEMYVGKTTMHRTKIKSSLRRWSFLSSSFFVQSSVRAYVRGTHDVSVVRTLKTCGLLVVVISCPQSHVLFSSISLSLARFLFTACTAVLWKWPSWYSHWLELFVEIRVFKNTTYNRQSRRDVRISSFFFVRVSVSTDTISFVRLLFCFSPFRSFSFSPSAERRNVT